MNQFKLPKPLLRIHLNYLLFFPEILYIAMTTL